MTKVPRVALFTPEESIAPQVTSLFQKHEYNLRTVSSTEEVAEISSNEDEPFETIVVPISVQGGGSAIGLCVQLKAEPQLSAIPVLVLSTTKEKAIVNSLYGAGADAIEFQPFDADLVHMRIGALSRQRRAYDEMMHRAKEESGLRQSTVDAFDAIQEGVFIADNEHKIVLLNTAARKLLGIQHDSDDTRGIL